MKRAVLVLAAAGLLGVSTGQATADLPNGGFETGDFTGWTTNGARDLIVVPNGYAGTPSHSGNYYANFGTFNTFGTIGQTVSDTAGTNYALSMYLKSDGGGNSFGGPILDEFKVTWDGVTLYDGVNIPAGPYQLLSFAVQGTGNDTLSLSGLDNGSNPGALALDDVSLGVPEPSNLILIGLAAIPAFHRRRISRDRR